MKKKIKREKSKFKISIWFGVENTKIELKIISWFISNSFLILNCLNEVRAMSINRVNEFVVQDLE